MATAGQDGLVKVWDCRNWKGAIRKWNARGGGGEVEWSQRGALAVASGGTVNVRSYVTFSRSVLIPSPGVHQAVHRDTFRTNSVTATLPHPPDSAPPAHITAVLLLP